MKVLITGCNGQVGFSLGQRLKDKVELLLLDYKSLDISDQNAVVKIISEFRPDYIINAAAFTAVDRAEKEIELAYNVNRNGPKYLAEAAKKFNAVILHISTDYVFDGSSDNSYKENDDTLPQSIYGMSKLEGERAVANNCIKHIILRTSWIFGEHGTNFVKTMLNLAKDKKELNIVGDQFGGPTYAGDVADTLISIIKYIENNKDIKEPIWGTYHYCGAPHTSWYDFAAYIFEIAEKQHVIENKPKVNQIPTTAYPTPAKRPQNSRLNCKHIENQFGIKPSNWKKALNKIQAYK